MFDTPQKVDIDTAFSAACGAHSLVEVLNYKLKKKGYKTYLVGIGVDYGRALMVKAGHKGSTINDVISMGDVVNSACHLASNGNSAWSSGNTIILSNAIYRNLNKHNQGLCSYNNYYYCYQSDAIITLMNDWIKEQKEKDKNNQSPFGFNPYTGW